MSKHAVITCGFPRSGKTRHYKSNYSDYSYFNTDIPSKNPHKEVRALAKSKDNIYIDGRNPIRESRNFYTQLLKKRGYSVECLWFTNTIEGILSHSFDISKFFEKQEFYSQVYSFQNHFEPPNSKDPFTVLKKIPPLPDERVFGDEKALFMSLDNIFIKRHIPKFGDKKSRIYDITHSQFCKIVEEYSGKNYKIIIMPCKMQYVGDENKIKKISRRILKELDIPFTVLAFDPKNGMKMGTYRVAYPEPIIKVSREHNINLEESIMVGEQKFEHALSVLSGCKYYFHRDVFFESQNYVKTVLKGEYNDSNY